MINVVLYEKNNNLVRFNVSGHAGYEKSGLDIVCSAVSMLSINTANAIDELTNTKCMIEQREGFIDVRLIDIKDDSQLLMRAFELGITSVVTEYGEFVDLSYRR